MSTDPNRLPGADEQPVDGAPTEPIEQPAEPAVEPAEPIDQPTEPAEPFEEPAVPDEDGLADTSDEADAEAPTEPEAPPSSQPRIAQAVPAAAATTATTPATAPVRRGGGPPPPQTPKGDETPFIDDPVTKWWVVAIAGVFGLVFLYAIFFGSNGLLTPHRWRAKVLPCRAARRRV
jgi:hypothetical protein